MFARLTASWLALSFLLGACSTTAETAEVPVEEGPARVAVDYRVTALNRCEGEPPRVQAIRPRGEDLVLLQVGGPLSSEGVEEPLAATLRAPGACGSLPLCGHLLVRVDPSSPEQEALRFRVATRLFELPLGALENPLGPHTVEIQFHDDGGFQALGADGQPLARTIQLDIVASDDPGCAPQP